MIKPEKDDERIRFLNFHNLGYYYQTTQGVVFVKNMIQTEQVGFCHESSIEFQLFRVTDTIRGVLEWA